MAQRRALIALVVVTLAASTGCDDERTAVSRDDLIQVDVADAVEVVIGADGFEPAEITIETGGSLVVRNGGREIRRVQGERVDTGDLEPGESVLVFFDEEGTVEIHDRADPTHGLTVEVVQPRVVDGE